MCGFVYTEKNHGQNRGLFSKHSLTCEAYASAFNFLVNMLFFLAAAFL